MDHHLCRPCSDAFNKKYHHFQDSLSSFYEKSKHYLLVFSKHKTQRHLNIWLTSLSSKNKTLRRRLKNHWLDVGEIWAIFLAKTLDEDATKKLLREGEADTKAYKFHVENKASFLLCLWMYIFPI